MVEKCFGTTAGLHACNARRISLAIGTLAMQGRSRCARVITVAKRRRN